MVLLLLRWRFPCRCYVLMSELVVNTHDILKVSYGRLQDSGRLFAAMAQAQRVCGFEQFHNTSSEASATIRVADKYIEYDHHANIHSMFLLNGTNF